MKEKQVIVEWYEPSEKLPSEDIKVVATINGRAGNSTFDHAFMLMSWCRDEGWYSLGIVFDELEVLAWCDLMPYGYKEVAWEK